MEEWICQNPVVGSGGSHCPSSADCWDRLVIKGACRQRVIDLGRVVAQILWLSATRSAADKYSELQDRLEEEKTNLDEESRKARKRNYG